MLKKLLASSSGNKNGSSNIYMNGKEIYKIYQGQNLVYDVYNGRDFNYQYNYLNGKFTFTNWKQTHNCVANTTHFIIADDNTIVLSDFLRTYNAQIQNITIPYNVTMTNGDINSLFYNHSTNLKYASINSHSVTNMYRTYYNCTNMKSSPTCGNNVVSMREAYYACWNLIGSPVVGPNVTDMYRAYAFCRNITGSPVCGAKVTSFAVAYQNCYNLTGNPVCPPNTTSMYASYLGCYNIKGDPVCGTKVVNMGSTYHNCFNLTGSPVCGPNVNDMVSTYDNCYNLIGTPVCGNKVTNMYHTYYGCHSLTGAPACGENVMDMDHAYHNCYNISGNAYFYSNKVRTVQSCFYGRNTSRRLNIHVPKTGLNYSYNTLATCLHNGNTSFVRNVITWSQSGVNYYNTFYNIYIYPVDNVEQAYKENELSIAKYVMEAGSNIIPFKEVSIKEVTINTDNKGSVIGYFGVDTNDMESITIEGGLVCVNSLEDTTDDTGRHCSQYVYRDLNYYGRVSFMLTLYHDTNEIQYTDTINNEKTNYIVYFNNYILCDGIIEDTTNDDGTITRVLYLENENEEMPSQLSFDCMTPLLRVEHINTKNIKDATNMFRGCSNLTYVKTSNWNTSKITKADYMFAGCTSLTDLDPFELPNVVSASHIFDYDYNPNYGGEH